MRRRRLDSEIVRRKLAGSEQEAAALIATGRVTVGGAPATNAGRFVGANEAVVVLDAPPRFVTRAGAKLAAGLERFDLAVDGARALDTGASGGGFTDCLLQHGARQVVAVDVGYGLLHERLRADPRVEVRDRTNVRDLAPGDLGPPFDLVVADLSFISLRLVLPQLVGQGRGGANVVLLVKPQFEATKAEASRGRGVISDPAVWRRVLAEVADDLATQGADVLAGAVSPIRGAEGNVEFLLHAALPQDDRLPRDGHLLDVDEVVTEAQRAIR
jgi:23S rRNA (cytidine1920-2'-O)/16S rRNA (cytidine1409-2'-O)-methyltransferase